MLLKQKKSLHLYICAFYAAGTKFRTGSECVFVFPVRVHLFAKLPSWQSAFCRNQNLFCGFAYKYLSIHTRDVSSSRFLSLLCLHLILSGKHLLCFVFRSCHNFLPFATRVLAAKKNLLHTFGLWLPFILFSFAFHSLCCYCGCRCCCSYC